MKSLLVAILPVLVFGFVASISFAAGSIPDAAAEPPVPPWALGVGITGGVIGGPLFAVWFSWYMTTRRVPTMEKRWQEERMEAEQRYTTERKFQSDKYSTERKDMELRHAAHVELLMTNYRADLNTMWDKKQQGDEKLLAGNKELVEAIGRLTQLVGQSECKYERQNVGPPKRP